MDWLPSPVASALVGLFGGILLGLAARRGRFCTLGAIEDALYGGDWDRVRMWALALAIAISGTFLLAEVGVLDLSTTIYARFEWNPIGSILGGLIFGYGMAIAGNCGYGALARFGGGDLRSFMIVLVTGISAYITISGPLALARVTVFPNELTETEAPAGYAQLLGETLSLPAIVPALIIALLLASWAFGARSFRTSRTGILWSMVVGLAIISGWAGSAWIAADSFDAITVGSHTFTAPLGETLIYLMTSSGGGLGFAVGSVTGVILGALIGSISKGHFRWEACDDPGELGRQILGGALMGVGGVLALGCSVGQGLTAFSTLTYSAPIVLLSIFIGAAVGLRQLIRGFEAAE